LSSELETSGMVGPFDSPILANRTPEFCYEKSPHFEGGFRNKLRKG
jgi:hypothetical protein